LLDARITVAVGRADRLQAAKKLAHALAFGVSAPKKFVETARLGDGVECRIRNESIDLPSDHQSLASLHLGPLHAPRLHAPIYVADERILGLVIVMVRVEGGKTKFVHYFAPCPPGSASLIHPSKVVIFGVNFNEYLI
jgi:hypothetical protein